MANKLLGLKSSNMFNKQISSTNEISNSSQANDKRKTTKMPNQKNDNKKQVADFVNVFITQ